MLSSDGCEFATQETPIVSPNPPDLVAALGLVTQAKVALSLDPALYTSKTVVKQIGVLTRVSRHLRDYLSSLPKETP